MLEIQDGFRNRKGNVSLPQTNIQQFLQALDNYFTKRKRFYSLFCCSLKTAGFPFTGHLTVATLTLLKGQYCHYNPKPAELLQLMKRHK